MTLLYSVQTCLPKNRYTQKEITAKTLSWYAKNLEKSRRSHVLTTQSLLFLARHEKLFQHGISFLNQHPQIFQHLLSLNMGKF